MVAITSAVILDRSPFHMSNDAMIHSLNVDASFHSPLHFAVHSLPWGMSPAGFQFALPACAMMYSAYAVIAVFYLYLRLLLSPLEPVSFSNTSRLAVLDAQASSVRISHLFCYSLLWSTQSMGCGNGKNHWKLVQSKEWHNLFYTFRKFIIRRWSRKGSRNFLQRDHDDLRDNEFRVFHDNRTDILREKVIELWHFIGFYYQMGCYHSKNMGRPRSLVRRSPRRGNTAHYPKTPWQSLRTEVKLSRV